jgi:threonine aldolase
VENHAEARLEYPVQANEVFLNWTKKGFDHLKSQGIQFQLWPGRDDLARYVFGHSTSDEETDLLADSMR